jgi:hypothetical protein
MLATPVEKSAIPRDDTSNLLHNDRAFNDQ